MDDLESILNMLDCGVVKIIFNGDHRTVEWANDAFYSLTGSTRKEYEDESKSGNPRNVLHPDDFERVFAAFDKQKESKKALNIQYRVFHKDGSIVWLDVVSNFTGYKDGNACFINIMNNITESKKNRELREYELKRYQLVCELSHDILFEYDIERDEMINYSSTSYHLGTSSIDDFLSNPEAHGMLTEDGIDILRQFFLKEVIDNKQHNCSQPIQIMTKQGYKWFTVTCGIANHVIIGKLTDVDEDVKLVRSLRQSVQCDAMTGLLNKAAMLNQVTQLLRLSPVSGRPPKAERERERERERESLTSKHHAMVVFDIDDFKQANDNFGHSFGDEIIRVIAECTKESFRLDDLKGRFGGDEFVVVIKNTTAPAAQLLVERYRQNLATKCQPYEDRYVVTISIGISFFPQHGETFDELFKKADYALYQAKNQGKNQAIVYAEDA
ncbi:diguanylate cyclase [uncultured Bilophila sp.]|uniref:diguanylate cyclase n=1 Tax=uncultured Bilophila sp. TaxID=529385 RepID=UPI00280AEA19|nr:diguanylate cyclase [uncultured Bilophila sp.]